MPDTADCSLDQLYNGIEFFGKEYQKIIEIYTAADVFLNLSVEETFGLTTVEAIACNTPVIVYDATALSEVVTDCAVLPHDYKKLLLLIYNNPPKQYFNPEYTIQSFIKKHMEVYSNE